MSSSRLSDTVLRRRTANRNVTILWSSSVFISNVIHSNAHELPSATYIQVLRFRHLRVFRFGRVVVVTHRRLVPVKRDDEIVDVRRAHRHPVFVSVHGPFRVGLPKFPFRVFRRIELVYGHVLREIHTITTNWFMTCFPLFVGRLAAVPTTLQTGLAFIRHVCRAESSTSSSKSTVRLFLISTQLIANTPLFAVSISSISLGAIPSCWTCQRIRTSEKHCEQRLLTACYGTATLIIIERFRRITS